MNVHIGYKVQKTPDIEKEIHVHVDKLRRRLQVFRPELVHLKGTVEPTQAREGTQVSLNLRLPSGQMVSQQSASTATVAIKGAFDELLQQITRHKDLLRSAHKWRRRGSTNGVEVGVPFEETLAAVHPAKISAEDVRSYKPAAQGKGIGFSGWLALGEVSSAGEESYSSDSSTDVEKESASSSAVSAVLSGNTSFKIRASSIDFFMP